MKNETFDSLLLQKNQKMRAFGIFETSVCRKELNNLNGGPLY